MKTSRVQGFTLIELLVVVAIIALLIAILIPALGRAKALAVQGACAASMSSVGKGVILYQNSYDGKYPASYQYVGSIFVPPCGNSTGDLGGPGTTSNTGSEPTVKSGGTNGYIHWSYFLYNNNLVVPTTKFVIDAVTSPSLPTSTQSNNSNGNHSTSNTTDHLTSPYSGSNPKAFVCGAFADQGGLPATNPFQDQLASGQVSNNTTVADYQAPRIAFTLNEAVCPRNKFTYNFLSDGSYINASRFVKDSEVGTPQTVILGTEFNTNFAVCSGNSTGNGATLYCKAHRPVNGFALIASTGYTNPDNWALSNAQWRGVCQSDLWDNSNSASNTTTDKSPLAINNITDVNLLNADFSDPNGSPSTSKTLTRLDWVGRNHPGNKTNFLYCDGHVESKLKEQTISTATTPTTKVGDTGGGEWGEKMYSLITY